MDQRGPRIETLLARLPTGIEVERAVRCGDGEGGRGRFTGGLVKGRIEGAPVALRVLALGGAAALTELELLRSIDVPRVPKVVASGVLEGGGAWLAREWIEGHDLNSLPSKPGPQDWPIVFGDVAHALHAVHGVGLVHGDIAPGNVVVDGNGRGWLTDFGLGRRLDSMEPTRAAGTPIFMAPERLVGGALTPAADLFGLGAMMAVTLSGRTPDPARFYGRFPREPFLDAAEIDFEALPEGSRSLIAALTRRSPSERVHDARVVAEALDSLAGGRVPGEVASDARGSAPWIDPLAGRVDFADRIFRSTKRLQRVRTSDSGEAGDLGAALALWFARHGKRAVEIDLSALAQSAGTSLASDRLVARVSGEWSDHTIFCVVRELDTWSKEILVAIASSTTVTRSARVVVLVPTDVDALMVDGLLGKAEQIDVPRFTHAALLECLGRATSEGESTTALVDAIDRAAEGSSHHAARLIRTAARQGAFVQGPEGLRVAPAFDSTSLASVDRAFDLGGATILVRRLAAAVSLRARPIPAVVLSRHLAGDAWKRVLDEAARRLLVVHFADGTLGPARRLEPIAALPSKADRRALHDDLARLHSLLDEPIEFGWLHRLAGSEPDVATISREIDGLFERGLAARVARGLEFASVRLGREGAPLPAPLRQVHVTALFRAGDAIAAQRAAKGHASPALQQLVRGFEESAAGRHMLSARTFRSAGFEQYAALEDAHAAIEGGRDFVRSDGAGDQVPARAVDDFETRRCRVEATSFRALALSREAAHGEAILLIDGEIESIAKRIAPATVSRVRASVLTAALLINRSTVNVQAGQLREAAADLERALKQYVALGSAPGIAEAQSQLGKIAKDRGDLLEAEEYLATALERRVRLANVRKTALTRGLLGLVRSERGHLRTALDQLTAARSVFSAESMNVARDRMDGVIADVEFRLGRRRSGALEQLSEEVGPLIEYGPRQPVAAELQSHAKRAADRGVDRLAARYAIAAFAAATDAGEVQIVEGARRAADRALARVLEGLTAGERKVALRTLLRGEDPRPADIDLWESRRDDDMDVLRILQLNERLVREESRDTLLRAIVEAALEVADAERGFLVLEEGGELELETAFVSSSGEIEDEEIEWSRSIVTKALETSAPVRLADAAGDVDWSEMRSVESIGIRSILAAPFNVEESVRGVIVVDDRSRPGAFGPREEKLLGMLAGQAALALRQIRRLEAIEGLSARLRERVAVQSTELLDAHRALDLAGAPAPVEGLVGPSKAMDDVRRLIHKVAPAEYLRPRHGAKRLRQGGRGASNPHVEWPSGWPVRLRKLRGVACGPRRV